METAGTYDVVVCGAGLAGLTLVRQLRLELPQLSIAIVDRLTRPLPEAAHKVGESSVEAASTYFSQTLGLKSYLAERHLPKLGLRFYFGSGQDPLETRPEFGPKAFSPITSYQLDRGRLENDLREMIVGMGVTLLEGTHVEDIVLMNGGEPHVVLCRQPDGSEQTALRARWVIDALGRRRLLQSKLGLIQSNGHSASAAWWRVNSRADVNAMVKKNGDRAWHQRTIEDRYLSTNHLMGRGYWVWFIPLGSGATSIGIVTDETIHPLNSYGRSHAQALEWLYEHEPSAWQLLKNIPILDFHRLKNFSYHSRQIFSPDRWSCVGEAGLFVDPLYSPGSDFIALGNTITVEMIGREFRGELTVPAVDEFNRLVLDFLAPMAVTCYRNMYQIFGHAHIFAAKFAWDVAVDWSMRTQAILQGVIRRPTPEVFALMQKYKELNERVQRLFVDWAQAVPPRAFFVAPGDLARMRFLCLLHIDLASRRNASQFLRAARLNLDRLEELAQILFWQAVSECRPEHMPKNRARPPWINPWQMTLTPDRWNEDRLFDPITAPRPLRAMREGTFAGIFAPMTWSETIRVGVPYWLMHIAGGKPAKFAFKLIHDHLFANKPAMRIRGILITDYPSDLKPAVGDDADRVTLPRAAPQYSRTHEPVTHQ
jgi:flavin-dependent dehydrogenase